jgi:hypothetical protein
MDVETRQALGQHVGVRLGPNTLRLPSSIHTSPSSG